MYPIPSREGDCTALPVREQIAVRRGRVRIIPKCIQHREMFPIFGGGGSRRLRLLIIRVVEENARRARSDRRSAVPVFLHLGLR